MEKSKVKSKSKDNSHTISVVIIVQNEEKNIARVVKNVSFADEVVVIDNNSTDKTAKLAKKCGARVYSKKFTSFSQQRNFGLEKAKGEWILYIDADERISSKLKREILKAVVKSQSLITYYQLRRKNFYFGKYEWPYIEGLERLFRKKSLKGWKGVIHESPVVLGDCGELSGYLLHYTHTDLSSMIDKTNQWSEIEAELLYKANHPRMSWWRFLRIMLTKFYYSFVKQGGWRVGVDGWIESIYQAFSYFIVYAKVWEYQNITTKNSNVRTTD